MTPELLPLDPALHQLVVLKVALARLGRRRVVVDEFL